ncbi:unnamed protein product [Closterium sp. Naga37s-1]|nr:unnamed protein product [Closterium sp. Naga37s-1]
MAPRDANVPAAAAAAAGGVLNKQGSEPVTPRTLFNGVQGPFGAEAVNELSARTSALRINDLPEEGKDKRASASVTQTAAPAVQGKVKDAVKEAEEEDGYLSDDPDECQGPDAVNDIASQAGFAITLLIPAKWIEEVPRMMDTVRGLLLLWEEHLTENMKSGDGDLLKRKRTAFLEGSAFHRVLDPVTGSDTDKIKGLVYRHPGDKSLRPLEIQLTSVPPPLQAAASLKLTSATKAIMEDPAVVFTSTNGAREEWLCVQEGCGRAHDVSFAKAAEHAASVMQCTERLKAGSATRQSRGKMNLLAVKKEFGM